jgi:hypothetical protein
MQVKRSVERLSRLKDGCVTWVIQKGTTLSTVEKASDAPQFADSSLELDRRSMGIFKRESGETREAIRMRFSCRERHIVRLTYQCGRLVGGQSLRAARVKRKYLEIDAPLIHRFYTRLSEIEQLRFQDSGTPRRGYKSRGGLQERRRREMFL